jgi:multiple sugar transport system permease protein
MVRTQDVFWYRLRSDLKGYAFLLPYSFFFLLFILVPLLYGFVLSFYSWDLFTAPKYVGLSNYDKLLFDDTRFWVSTKNTLVFVAESVPLLIIVPLIFALILNRPFWGRSWVFIAFVSVSFMPSPAIMWMWRWAFDYHSGLVNYYLGEVGLPLQNWLNQPDMAMVLIALITMWWTSGFNTILFLSGLQDIPRELYEAAQVDGGSRVAQFMFITVPMLRDKMILIGILTVMASFKMFDQVYLLPMSPGAPMGRTRTLTLYLYESGFRDFKIGKASAISWLMLTMMVAFAVLRIAINWRSSRESG